ncbi:putative EF-hand domain pair protein CML [Helianthus anomalus]
MKLPGKLIPKNLFKSTKKQPNDTVSTSSSFNSSITPSSPKSKSNGVTTPTSVLPTHSHDKSTSSDDLSFSGDVQYELLQAFRILDADNDGRITRSELKTLLSRIGGSEPVTDEELTVMINEIDADGDGSISFEEFGVISAAFGPPSCDDELRGAFEVFDADHDGLITAEELYEVFKLIGDGGCTLEECRRMISGVDKNGDGVVCFEDFVVMMEQQR